MAAAFTMDRVSVDLMDDKNLLIRPFRSRSTTRTPARNPLGRPGTGAAQVLVNNPLSVERLTIVEINAGYLALIAKYPEVMTILRPTRRSRSTSTMAADGYAATLIGNLMR